MTGHVTRRIEAPAEVRHGLADHQAHEKEEGRVLRLRKDVARLGTELSTTREHFGARTTAAARRSSDEIQNFVENEDRALFG